MSQSIKTTLKVLRQAKGLTQKELAARISVSRTAYTKIENGKTRLDIDQLHKISIALNVKISDILQEDESLSSNDQIVVMLYSMKHFLEVNFIQAVPFEELTLDQKKFLRKKGIVTKEEYITPHWGGRLYKFGPRDVFRMMVHDCSMQFFFESPNLLNEYWRTKWKEYQENSDEPEIDQREYFDVMLFDLKMPNSGPDEWRFVQMAIRDFPEGVTEENVIDYVVKKCGAVYGESLVWSTDGYDPVSEIIR